MSQRAGRGRFVLPRSGGNPRACDRTGAQQLKGELEIHNRAQGELFASARDLETSLGQAREQHVAGRQAAESEARETIASCEADLSQARTDLAGLRSRHQAIHELVLRRDGVVPGARILQTTCSLISYTRERDNL